MEPQNQSFPEPELEQIAVDGALCYAYRWRDELAESRREVNYAIKNPRDRAIYYLLVNCQHRFSVGTRLLAVAFHAGKGFAEDTGFNPAETRWETGDSDNESTARICSPKNGFQEYRGVPAVLERLIREYGDGKRVLAGQRNEPVQTVPPPADETAEAPPPAPEYVFRRSGHGGDYWRIVFDGCKLPPVRHLAGMTYLHALLAHPGHAIAALDLYEMENPPPPEAVAPLKGNALDREDREQYGTGGSHTAVMDEKTRKAIARQIAELEEELKDPDLGMEEKEDREETLDRLNKALSSGRVARATGGATFESKGMKRPRQAVAKAIDKAIDALADFPALAKHFRTAVRKGNTMSYARGLTWET